MVTVLVIDDAQMTAPGVRDHYYKILDELAVIELWRSSPLAVQKEYSQWARGWTGTGYAGVLGSLPPTFKGRARPARKAHEPECCCGRCTLAWNKRERALRLATNGVER